MFFLGLQGKAQRRGMRPRRAEQCLPEEGATPKWDAGAPAYHGRDRVSPPLPDPASRVPRATLWGAIPFQGVATQSCITKKHNLPCSELTKKVKAKCRKKTL